MKHRAMILAMTISEHRSKVTLNGIDRRVDFDDRCESVPAFQRTMELRVRGT
jgi:hypothetical protein